MRANQFKAKKIRLRILGAISSLVIGLFYVTGCGREAKINLIDNYKPTPVVLAAPENSIRQSNNGGFSTDLNKAEASLQVSPIDDPSTFAEVAFVTADVLECSAKHKSEHLIEVSLRFSSVGKGSVGVVYTSEVDRGNSAIQYFASKEIKRVAYQDSGRRNFTATTDATVCSFKTALVQGKEVRAFMNCSLRGVTENIHLNGYFSCQVLGAI